MTTYYVDARDGRDGGADGGTATPWKSVGYAYSRVAAGDTILLRGSNRDPASFYTGDANLLVCKKAGITIAADKGHTPTVTSGWTRALLRVAYQGYPYSAMFSHVMPNVETGKYADGSQGYSVAGKNSRYANWWLFQANDCAVDGITFQGMDRNVIKFDHVRRGAVRRCNFYWVYRQIVIAKFSSGIEISDCKGVHLTLMRMSTDPLRGANAALNLFPVELDGKEGSLKDQLTDAGNVAEVMRCYFANNYGDGVLTQESYGTSQYPIVFEDVTAHDGENFYFVASQHVRMNRCIAYQSDEREMYKKGYNPDEPTLIYKDEAASTRPGEGEPTSESRTTHCLFVKGRGPHFKWGKFKQGAPWNKNNLMAFCTVILNDSQVGLDVTLSQLPEAKVGPLVIQNNVFGFLKAGPLPGSGPRRDITYTGNATRKQWPKFGGGVVMGKDMGLRDPYKSIRSFVPPPWPVVKDGREAFNNWSDLPWQPNGTLTDFNPANYAPVDAKLNIARPYEATIEGQNTGGVMQIDRAVYGQDLFGPVRRRRTVGAIEAGRDVPPPPDPDPEPPGPDPEPEPGIDELVFSNGWAIVADADALRLRDPDGELHDFLTEVVD